jgi:hypothetical protein
MDEVSREDRVLTGITQRVDSVVTATRRRYGLIRVAKELGYSYNGLERATGFACGTLQNIVDGRNPRLTVD